VAEGRRRFELSFYCRYIQITPSEYRQLGGRRVHRLARPQRGENAVRAFPIIAAGVLISLWSLVGPALAQSAPQQGEAPQGVVEAFKRGTAHLGFRYRYEYVDDDAIEAKAHASTLRTMLNFRTAPLRGLDFFIEAENVVELGDDWYRDAGLPPRGNAVSGRPVVADPAGTDINQVMLRYRGHDTDMRFGRQEINIGDQRFIGAAGWRQHHQTFSAVNAENGSIDRVKLRYVFSNSVYRIFGDKVDTANNFLHGTIDTGKAGTLSVYGYLLNYTEDQFAALSTNSVGFEFAGALAIDDGVTALYEIEYARQTDAADNPNDVKANYAHLMGGFGFEQWVTARVGWELLGGSEENGRFLTPLATLHKFNGWADKFLNTPANGLEDFYVQLTGSVADIGWLASFHNFSADSVSATYGSEFDWQLSYQSSWSQTFALKGAYYSADTLSSDTLKIWLWTTYTF
jgi:hypothetical protein